MAKKNKGPSENGRATETVDWGTKIKQNKDANKKNGDNWRRLGTDHQRDETKKAQFFFQKKRENQTMKLMTRVPLQWHAARQIEK